MALSKEKIKVLIQDTLIKFYTDVCKPKLENHTHKYAGSSSAGGIANQAAKTTGTLTIQTNGTSAGTFNGSANKTVNITPSNIGAALATHNHNQYINPPSYGNIYINDSDMITANETEEIIAFTSGEGIDIGFGASDVAEFSVDISNAGVRNISTGSTNGTISVNTNGTTTDVAVKGLGSAAYTNSNAYATSSHTHNYAGSSSAGGSATSAEKLTHTLSLKAGNNKQLGSFDGSKSLSIDVGPTAIGAALEGHIHSDYAKKESIGYISVLEHGVVNDGTTDNTSAIQDLITNGYKNLYFPDGTYLFNITILTSNINIIGQLKTRTIFIPYSNNKSVIELNSSDNNITNCKFSNFTIRNNSSFSNTSGICVTGSNENDRHMFTDIIIENGFLYSISLIGRTIWSIFKNIWISGSLHSGIYMYGNTLTKNLNTFNNITIRSGQKYAVYANAYKDGTDSTFSYKSNIFLNCNFENNCLDSSVSNQAALYFYNMDNLSIINCYIENNKNNTSTCYGIMSNGTYTRALNINGCLIWGQDIGVKIDSLAMSGQITSCRMANNTKDIEIGNSSKAGTGNAESSIITAGNTLKHQLNRIADQNSNSFVSSMNPFSYPYRHANNSATPDVKNCNIVMCWTTESITNFLNGVDGQIITVRFYGSTSTKTISNGTYITLKTSDPVVLSAGDTISFIYFKQKWVEVSRSIGTSYTKAEVDSLIGDLNSLLQEINGTNSDTGE